MRELILAGQKEIKSNGDIIYAGKLYCIWYEVLLLLVKGIISLFGVDGVIMVAHGKEERRKIPIIKQNRCTVGSDIT